MIALGPAATLNPALNLQVKTQNSLRNIQSRKSMFYVCFSVAIGASAGLFLGCSILSFVEIVYFFSLRLFWFIYKRRFN
jgi:hypothetical protein